MSGLSVLLVWSVALPLLVCSSHLPIPKDVCFAQHGDYHAHQSHYYSEDVLYDVIARLVLPSSWPSWSSWFCRSWWSCLDRICFFFWPRSSSLLFCIGHLGLPDVVGRVVGFPDLVGCVGLASRVCFVGLVGLVRRPSLTLLVFLVLSVVLVLSDSSILLASFVVVALLLWSCSTS